MSQEYTKIFNYNKYTIINTEKINVDSLDVGGTLIANKIISTNIY